MTDAELMAVAQGFAPIVKQAITSATEPLLARIALLEQRQAPAGRDGRDGLPGAAGERGPAGEKGLDGQSVTVHDVQPLIAKLVADAVAAIPVPKDGRDGVDGKDGRDGMDGKDGAPGRDGEKGLDGLSGKDGADGLNGKDGRDGIDGKDGAPGPDGQKGLDGKDGRDGVNLEASDFASMRFDPDTRTLSLTFTRGEKSVTQSCSADGVMLYRDLFQEGKRYKHGDSVTWGGSLWYAKADVSEKPGINTDESRKWVLVAKRGSEGRRGDKGEPGPTGPRGPQGDRGPERW